jgi:L-malate glycosyltransferase
MAKPARVAQVLHSLRVGGAEMLAARVVRALRDEFSFVFFCLDELGSLGEQLQKEGFPVHVVGRRPGLDWRCARALSKAFRREEIELVQAHQYTPYFYSTMARFLYRRPPILFTEHGRHFPDVRRAKRVFVNRRILAKRDRVVAVGEAVRRALIDNEGLPAARIGVIYNGIVLPESPLSAQERQAVRQEMGVGADDFVVLMVARLDPLKDHATAILAAEAARRRIPDLRLVLIGDGPERPRIESLVRERSLQERVRFLGLRNDVSRLWAGADIALLSSISEGIPLTILEAMASWLPVVSTNVGGVGEVIVDGENGLLAPSRDAEALAGQLIRLAVDSDLRKRLAASGRRRVEETFGQDRMMNSYRRLFNDMLGR